MTVESEEEEEASVATFFYHSGKPVFAEAHGKFKNIPAIFIGH